MARDQFERSHRQFAARRNFVPGRCAGGMGQRDHVKVMPRACDAKLAANYFLQFCAVDELGDCQPADWNDQTWLQHSNLIVHPGRAVADFVRRRNAISAARILPRKTTAHRCEVNCGSNGSFIHPAKFFEPTEERFASGMRKGPLQKWLSRTRSLTDDHQVAHDRTTRYGRRFHARTTTTAQQLSNVPFELDLFTRRSHQRRKIEKIEKSKLSKMLRMTQVTIGK